MAGPVTPTPGICDRTQQVYEGILDELDDVDDCAAVTVADLAGITDLPLISKSIDSLKSGDFAGLTAVSNIDLSANQLGALPANLFSGLTSLTDLVLDSNALSLLPAEVFSGLTELTILSIANNDLTSLPAGVFSDLTALEFLNLSVNQLTSLPDGLFSGLTALATLSLNGNTTSPMELTVTVEKVGTGQVRAKVLAGAPSDLVLPVSVENGTLAGGATTLRVKAGSVDGEPLTVIRTGDTGDVTVDLGTPLPSLPDDHEGYEYVKAASGLPVEVPDALEREPGVEGDLRLAEEEPYTHTDGYVGVSGRAEIFHAERWGTVSSDGFSRAKTSRFALNEDGSLVLDANGAFTETVADNEAPALFCQAMGYETGEYTPDYGQPGVPSQTSMPEMPYYSADDRYPVDGPEPIWVDDMTCVAGEADLTVGALPAPMAHCGFAGWGLHNSNHSEDAGVRCWNEMVRAEAGARALKARFVSPPEHHDGSGRVKVRVAFSEAIEESPENVGEHGVQVEGGRVTSVRQVDNQPAGGAAGHSSGGQEDEQEDGERVWEFEIEPGSDDDLTMRIDAGGSCDEPGAICTADGRSLSEGIATTVEGPDPVPLTAAFEGLPEAHDGEDTFHFRVAFSEDIGIGFRTMRDESFTVDGGEVTGARRVDRRHDLWQITVAPDGAGEVTVTLAAGRACAVSGAICTRGGDRRQLTNTATATVAGPVDEAAPAVLTASFVEAPHEHDGETAFTLRIAFSEGIAIGFRTFRDQSVSVSGGSVTHAKRVDRRKDLWKVTVEPGSRGDVTVTLAGGRACGTAGAVCTGDGRALSAGISTTVLGPAALTVADARAKEGTDETIDFTVSLSRATRAAVTVAYATADGTATAGSDYTATSGTLTFAAGETEQTVSVPVLDDAHDEGEETLTLRLTNATGAVIADGEATGTIKNTDPLQRAWLARFGRTAATHVTDAVGERLRDGSGASHVTVGGYRLPLGQRATGTAEPGGATTEPETTTDRLASLLTGLAGMAGLGAGQAGGPGADPGGGGPGWDAWPDAGRDPRLGQSHGVTLDLRRLLLGSSFRLNLGAAATGSAGPRLTAWGRVAGTAFDGRDGNVSLEGDVLTGTVGVDGAWDRLLAGLAVAHSRGDGSFTKPGTADRGRGELETTLTSIHPYLRYAVNDRLDVWSVLGYGRGQMEMAVATGETMETDMALVMGAFGGRGILLPAGETGGFELATRTDAMLTRTSSDAVAGMVSADAEAHRLRLVLEGSRGFAWPEGRRLTPTMEVGLRHDWGDAETGFGLELGGRVHYADPALGLTIDAAVRGLLAHEDDDYQEWGASGSLRLAPGAGGQGLALTLAPTWGAASSGVNGLWSRQTTAGLAPQGNRQTPAGQLNAEVGYGVAAPFGTGLLTPYAGTVLSDGAARTYRVGGRLQMRGGWATGLTLNLEGTRQDPAGQQPVNQGLRLQLTWGF